MHFFKHSTDFQNQRKKEAKELLVNKSCFYQKLLLKTVTENCYLSQGWKIAENPIF